MNLRALLASTVLTLAALASAPANAEPVRDAPAGPANDCATVKSEARYIGYGYYHVVILKNGCSKPVTCEVWTDVDPTPRQTVTAKPGETAEVVTRRGSPAREFKADRSCKY
jgi:hypothetical protein